jgi:WD40 repeat protein
MLIREMKRSQFAGWSTGAVDTSLAFSPDGRLLASAGSARQVRLWQVEDGALVREMEHESLGFEVSSAVEFSRDGQLITLLAETGKKLVWRVEDGTPVNQG